MKDIERAAETAIQAWDVLTDTTRPDAFMNLKNAMETLRAALEDREAQFRNGHPHEYDSP